MDLAEQFPVASYKISLSPATPGEIETIIKDLKGACAGGYDDITAGPVKAVSHSLCIPFIQFCNMLKLGCFAEKKE